MPMHIEYGTKWDEVKGFARISFIRHLVLTYEASEVMFPERIMEVLSAAAMVTKSKVVQVRDYRDIKEAVYFDEIETGFIYYRGEYPAEGFVHFRNLKNKVAIVERTRSWWGPQIIGHEFKFEGDFEFLKSVIGLPDVYGLHQVEAKQLAFDLKGEVLTVTYPKSAVRE